MQALTLLAAGLMAPSGAVSAPSSTETASSAPSQPTAKPATARQSAHERTKPETVVWSVPVLHTTALFTGMRFTEAVLWPTPFADPRPSFWLQNYEQAFTRPPLFDSRERAFEWDHDPWPINVVGHGLLGSELYYRPRRCGASVLEALVFATAASAVWEYAFEANGVRPSAQDLVYTPLSGLVLGEARYFGWSVAGDIPNRTLRGILRAVLDPLGELERAANTPC